MAHQDLVFDRHTFAYECVTRYFAPPADFGVLLSLDKGANFRFIAHFAAVLG